jgi:hypothetical protein
LTAALILAAAHLLGAASSTVFGIGTQAIGLGFLVAAAGLGFQLVRAIHRSEQDRDR